MVTSYPLRWPDGWRRSTSYKSAKFLKNGRWLTISDGVQRVLLELQRIGVHRDDVIVSTNVRTRLDGFPRADQPEPVDKGVAVYWRKADGPMQCMAIDIYNLVADNLGAIAATLEAMRAIERHGGAQVQERIFRGFTALPERAGRKWDEVLFPGMQKPLANYTRVAIENAYRYLAKSAHPDMPGGSHEEMTELNQAREQALKEVTQ